MDTPRILAIDDVHLAATPAAVDDLVAFYTGLIGLDRVGDEADDKRVTFRGYPRAGPRLVISLGGRASADPRRRRMLIQVACLRDCADQMTERAVPFSWSRGWTFYDRRLTTLDPLGHRVGLVAYHEL